MTQRTEEELATNYTNNTNYFLNLLFVLFRVIRG